MKKNITTLASLVGVVALVAYLHFHSRFEGGLAPEVLAVMTAEPLSEISGMVKSRSYPDTYWVVNDSGDEARLFAINREGKNIIPTFSRFSFYGEEEEEGKEQWQGFRVLYAENVDWETMTVDDNYLYVGDVGNNFNSRENLGIYMLSEIDPTASTQSAAIRHIPVRYPEQTEFPGLNDRHFDSEALFAADGSLYLITKHRSMSSAMEQGANLYRLDTQFTDQDNLLTLIDSNQDMIAVTGAELSPNGQHLAVISYEDLWIFDRPQSGDAWLSSSARRYALNEQIVDQVESVIWDDDHTLLLSNEQRSLFLVDLQELGENIQ